jgi:hypothetical protein
MASLHPAAGIGASVPLHHHAFAASHNPFLNVEQPNPSPLLPAASRTAPLAESVEVTVMWSQTVLAVAQLTPPRSYTLGERGDTDFTIAAERLGATERELVTLRDGVPLAVFIGESPRVLENGKPVDATGVMVDCADIAAGARGIELREGRVVVVESSGLTFRLAGSEKPERLPRAPLGGADRSALATLGGAAILQGLLVASLAYLTPSMAWGDEGDLERDRLELMQQYLRASAELEREPPQQPTEPGGGEKGAPAERNRGPEGKAGSPSAKQAGRMAIKGDTAERAMSRAELTQEAASFGIIAVLSGSPAPSSPWGAELATGPDDVNVVGDMFSASIGEGLGNGGLGLSGLGQGGGGKGIGVGLGQIGTCMGGTCNGDGRFGSSGGRLGGTHQVRSASVRMARDLNVSGRLPPEVIQRTVRQNFGRFRSCYEIGLRSNPNLEGRVVARFVIGRDGAVSNVSAGGDLPDSQVRSCVASAFYGLSFPAPENGIVTVSYPIVLTPS